MRLHPFPHGVLERLELQARLARGHHEPIERVGDAPKVEHGDVGRALVVQRVDDHLDVVWYAAGDVGSAGGGRGRGSFVVVVASARFGVAPGWRRFGCHVGSSGHGSSWTASTVSGREMRAAASEPSTTSSPTWVPRNGWKRSTCCLPAWSSSA